MSAFSGDDIEVTWATLGGASEADWIGLYAAGAADSAALERKSTAGQLTGAAYFPAPKSAGTYEMRYFSGSDAVRVAVSNPIVVTARSAPATALR